MVKPINLTDEEDVIEETVNEPTKNQDEFDEKDAKNFIQGILSYFSKPDFDKKLVEQAQNSGLDKKVIANNFAGKLLGKISDIVHVGIDTVGDVFATLISILAGLLIKGGELICRVAKRLVSIVTFNYTCA